MVKLTPRLPGYDFASAHEASKHLVVFISYEVNEEGKRDNPRLVPGDFSLCGLQFHFAVKPVEDTGFALHVNLAEASSAVLASGWEIQLEQDVIITTMSETSKLDPAPVAKFDDAKTSDKILDFSSEAERFTFKITATAQHLHPYRQQFVDARLAEKYADCAVVLSDGAAVHVNKGLLAMTSSFFDQLFFEDAADNERVTLKDIGEAEFLEYLYCIYPPNRPFAMERMPAVLKLANRFGNTSLKCACEMFLLTRTSRPDRCSVLKWANQFDLDGVFARTADEMEYEDLKRITRESDPEDFKPKNWRLIRKRLN